MHHHLISPGSYTADDDQLAITQKRILMNINGHSPMRPQLPHASRSIQNLQETVENLYPYGTNISAVQHCAQFQNIRMAQQHNPLTMTAQHIGIQIIPGPISLRCDNRQFLKSWMKYILQSAICVITHTLSFLVALFWMRFLFTRYYASQHGSQHNDIAAHTSSILSFLSFSSWLWAALCVTNIIFFLGFTIQTWVIPIQWNFEDASNTKLFRTFGVAFILSVIGSNFVLSALQILGITECSMALLISQIAIVMIFAFVILFVIIKKGRNAECIEQISMAAAVAIPDDAIAVHARERRESAAEILGAFADRHHCSKLALICSAFSFVVTASIASLLLSFHFVFPFLLNRGRDSGHTLFDSNFATHLAIVILGVLLIGDVLILLMRILMRWLTLLLSDSYNEQREHARMSLYGSMTSWNRMILFVIPLMFVLKLTVFVMLYCLFETAEFVVGVFAFCVCSRCFDHLLIRFENGAVRRLMRLSESDSSEDTSSASISMSSGGLHDNHLLAQCSYIHDIIQYIATLLVPLMLGVFGVDLEHEVGVDGGKGVGVPLSRYAEMAAMQMAIQLIFDVFPLLLVLAGNAHSASVPSSSLALYQMHRPPLSALSSIAMGLKAEYINMMNGWTATDRCVRHFLWWSTIFIGGYFAFFLLYPQQFLCAVKADAPGILESGWRFVQCQ